GSDATFGFWQAVVISLCTVVTLGGHDGPFLKTIIARTVTKATPAAVAIVILRPRDTRARATLRRPCSIKALVRSSAADGRLSGSARPASLELQAAGRTAATGSSPRSGV